MHFDKESLKHLSKLCRIECDEEELSRLHIHLESILAYVDELKKVNTEGVKETTSMTKDQKLFLHEDEVAESIPHDLFMANSPEKVGGMIKVPSMMN